VDFSPELKICLPTPVESFRYPQGPLFLKSTPNHCTDLACGVGLIGTELRRAGVTGRLTGVDLSSKMLEHALKTGHYNGGVFLRDLDAELDLGSSKFDMIVCTGATELLSNPSQFLKRVAQLMNQTSQFFVSFQHNDGKPNPIAYQGVKTFTVEEVHEILKSAGLRALSITPAPQAYLMPNADGSAILPVPFLLVSSCLRQE